MKVAAILCTFMAAVAVTASAVPEIQARDTCGAGYGGDQRRTNSPCNASNGDRHFCGCDRTGVVECRGGKWTEIRDCGSASCHGGNDGGAIC
ncbi:hypothetical protein B0T25DRAFT_591277 [Lasiosphaeria hispida]|uniref:DUF1962-domain-containing protein n=1 Tax=Lasiosphaeria hispida TaxID=260671 RepID=A0AAJ0HKC4_9PEZI|nr:hypothetical protein B0T25DRAFT_591277 [Lasiosphaeria hispida]